MTSAVSRHVLAGLTAGLIAMPALAQDPAAKPDGTWVSLNGTISTATDDSFVLDYGEGSIIVEMDDWDWYQEGKNLIAGDEVTVYGQVDDDLYELATIEASSVYVKNLNTYFYASSDDEEGLDYYSMTAPTLMAWMDITGTVTSVDGRRFTLDAESRELTVDTSTMVYNPMDDEGYQQVQEGDRVKVAGKMDYDLFEKRELLADMVITLEQDKSKTESDS